MFDSGRNPTPAAVAPARLQKVSSPAELEAALTASSQEDVWFFKHSTRCGVSDSALREFEIFAAARAPSGGARFYLIEVPGDRQVSSALAERLEVNHQSPQAILVRAGAAIWHASHWSITRDDLAKVE